MRKAPSSLMWTTKVEMVLPCGAGVVHRPIIR